MQPVVVDKFPVTDGKTTTTGTAELVTVVAGLEIQETGLDRDVVNGRKLFATCKQVINTDVIAILH